MSNESSVSVILHPDAPPAARRSHDGEMVIVSFGATRLWLTHADARALLASLSAVVLHTPECEALITEWRGLPQDSIAYRLAEFAVEHTAAEIRDELITWFDEDPPDSEAVRWARAMWPTLAPIEAVAHA